MVGFSVSAALPPHLQKFEIIKPTPEWAGERIKLPPEFAPKLELKGIEEKGDLIDWLDIPGNSAKKLIQLV